MIAALAVMASTVGVVVTAPPAAAYPSNTVSLIGHGYGHGRGMGQWGAFGYALAGTPWKAIVSHYYSGSTPTLTTPAQEGTAVRVALTENDGNDVIVTSASGFTVAGHHFSGGQAVLMHDNGAGSWDLSSGSSCAGPWTGWASGVANPEAVPDTNSNIGASNAATLALQLCQVGGNLYVRGYLEAIYNSSAQARTVNILPLEDYIVGVVPNESPAYWGQIGSPGPDNYPWGFQSLEAQAVAARSYVMSALGSYGGYADTCDLTCQTYRGLANESTVTDNATLDTLGYVMEEGTTIMTTEYSASTGGYTAPGTFPAVPDAGDAVCPPGINGACNPNHDWSVSIPVSSIEATWPQLGTLQSISVTSRNGYADLGGRVLSMTLVGSSQNVVVTGNQFAADFNLRSNWFALDHSLSAPAVAISATSDGKGYWINGSDGSVAVFGDATFYGSTAGMPLNAPVVGLAATPDNRGYWEVASDGGIFGYGDATFHGSTGGMHLNRPIVGMARTPSGNGYWLVASDGGIFSYGDAAFHGSTGSMILNQPVVGMAATPDGGGYWLVASDGGIFAFGDARFYGSMGAHPLNRPIVGMTSMPHGSGYRLVASDGGIFAFGTAGFFGSAGNIQLAQPIVGMAGTSDGNGYWMAAADGGIFSYGDASFYGSAVG
ncbi:MAG TPA: SpoIID/LytB domain-containing protein [Acidimicrobiales bacterium]